MSDFYTTKDGFLMTTGRSSNPDVITVPDDQELHIGIPPGFTFSMPPFSGARWYVPAEAWVDGRTIGELRAQQKQDFDRMRRSAYPPLGDFADALYWQSKGDNSKMTDYLAACEAVKTQFPKPTL